MRSLSSSSFLVLLLLQCGDVEVNPGPPRRAPKGMRVMMTVQVPLVSFICQEMCALQCRRQGHRPSRLSRHHNSRRSSPQRSHPWRPR